MANMRTSIMCSLAAALLILPGCDDNTDTDGDGKVSQTERAEEMARDGYLPIQPGKWNIRFEVKDVKLPAMVKGQADEIKAALSKEAAGHSCLSEAEASKPGADFFGGEGTENCTYTSFDIAGNRAKLGLSCGMGGLGKAAMDLDGTVGDTEFQFDTKLVLEVPMAGKIEIQGATIGKHEGKCTDGA